jgi:hypothetical protein
LARNPDAARRRRRLHARERGSTGRVIKRYACDRANTLLNGVINNSRRSRLWGMAGGEDSRLGGCTVAC